MQTQTKRIVKALLAELEGFPLELNGVGGAGRQKSITVSFLFKIIMKPKLSVYDYMSMGEMQYQYGLCVRNMRWEKKGGMRKGVTGKLRKYFS